MHEIETHTEEYLVLVPEGRGLMEEYKPDDWLRAVMDALEERWTQYVESLCERWALYRHHHTSV